MGNEGKGEGGGEELGVGWGQAKELASPAIQCARARQNYPLANFPLVSPRWVARVPFGYGSCLGRLSVLEQRGMVLVPAPD